MRIVCSILLLVFISIPVYSQQQQTLQDGSNGGYGAPVVKVATVNGAGSVLLGGKGAWMIDHTFGIGGGGYLLVSNVSARMADTSGQRRMMLSYGGVLFEYTMSSTQLFYPTLEILIGGGAIGHEQDSYYNPRPHLDGFFVLEPGVTLNFCVASFFRIEAGASYRIVQGLSSALSTNSDLSGMTANLALKFGSFKNHFYFYGGGEYELAFVLKEKYWTGTYSRDGTKTKSVTWFSNQTPAFLPSLFAGVQLPGGINLKFKYYLTDFLNADYKVSGNSQEGATFDLSDLSRYQESQIFYFSVCWQFNTAELFHFEE